ncbi:hypothetical protein [Pimelobacter simplex]|uniref:hypothetical protein n=1 Tax=Nocardioides simplex TaxID=2045 RepID=UPI0021504C1C|nr:hypothetical protein [Pimelobacter simplex]UUW88385.1 hypothetical protein M0M43_21935 [Pimelobacter simplex]UUW97889.1 hypothetical protein M0M48_10580 [Pimelobacter simplex]
MNRRLAAALVVIALLCLLLSVALLAEAGLGDRGAVVASWVEAMATVLALAAAAAAAVFAWGAFQLEVQREERFTEDRRRSQAERFSGWCGEAEQKIEMNGKVYWDGLIDVIYLRNASDLPMNRVFGIVRTADGSNLGSLEIGMVPPSENLKIVHLTQEIAEEVDAAKRTHERQSAEAASTSIVIPEAFQLRVELFFTDAANLNWRRLADGELVPIT